MSCLSLWLAECLLNDQLLTLWGFPCVLFVVFPLLLFFFFNFIYLFNLWLCWVFVSVRGLSLVVASGSHSSSRCAGLSLSRPLLLRSTGCRRAGSIIVAHGPSCSAACGIFPDQGSNPCPLHWQADSQPLRHQGSPLAAFNMFSLYLIFDSLINMCLGMFLLGFILYGTLCASRT